MSGVCLAIIGPIGLPEMLVILVVGLLVFGSRLPEVGRSLGRGLMEFKRGLRGLQDEMDGIEQEADRRIDDEMRSRQNEPLPVLADEAEDPDVPDPEVARMDEAAADAAAHDEASRPPADQADPAPAAGKDSPADPPSRVS